MISKKERLAIAGILIGLFIMIVSAAVGVFVLMKI